MTDPASPPTTRVPAAVPAVDTDDAPTPEPAPTVEPLPVCVDEIPEAPEPNVQRTPVAAPVLATLLVADALTVRVADPVPDVSTELAAAAGTVLMAAPV